MLLLVVQYDKNEINRKKPEEVVRVEESATVSPEMKVWEVGRVE